MGSMKILLKPEWSVDKTLYSLYYYQPKQSHCYQSWVTLIANNSDDPVIFNIGVNGIAILLKSQIKRL